MRTKVSYLIGILSVILLLSVTVIKKADFFQSVELPPNAFFDPNHPTRLAYRETLERRLVNVGRAPFAIAHNKFDCKGFISSLKDLDFIHVAWLFNTFGTKYSCLNKILADPRLVTLQTNLINEPGHRNRRLEKHEFLYNISSPSKFDKLLKSRNPKLKAQFDKYVAPLQDLLVSRLQPQTECLINPGLESNVSARAGKVLVQWTREAFPFCKVVWNPLAKAKDTQGTGANLIEQHGWSPSFSTNSCIFNNDGSDINFPGRKAASAIAHEKDENSPKNYVNSGNALQSTIEELANQCKIAFLWVGEDNCFNYDGQGAPWVHPTRRSCKAGPVNKYVAKEVAHAHKNGIREPKEFVYSEAEESSFAGCSEIRKPHDGAKKNFLLKQSEFSDRGGVVITPTSLNGASSITVVHKGTKVDSYQRTGNYGHDGSQRGLWRSNKSPLKYPFKVAVRIKQGNKTICYRVNNPRIRND